MIDWYKVELKLAEHTYNVGLKDKLQHLYYEKGLSLEQIADLTRGECCGVSIGFKMKEFKMKLKGRGGHRNVRKPAIISQEDYMSMTYVQLMKKYKLSHATVYQRVKNYKRKLTSKSKVSVASP